MTDLKDVIWRIREKFPVDHTELLYLTDHIEALTAENERLQTGVRWPTSEDEAVAMFLVSERWLRDNAPHLFKDNAALGDTQ